MIMVIIMIMMIDKEARNKNIRMLRKPLKWFIPVKYPNKFSYICLLTTLNYLFFNFPTHVADKSYIFDEVLSLLT